MISPFSRFSELMPVFYSLSSSRFQKDACCLCVGRCRMWNCHESLIVICKILRLCRTVWGGDANTTLDPDSSMMRSSNCVVLSLNLYILIYLCVQEPRFSTGKINVWLTLVAFHESSVGSEWLHSGGRHQLDLSFWRNKEDVASLHGKNILRALDFDGASTVRGNDN